MSSSPLSGVGYGKSEAEQLGLCSRHRHAVLKLSHFHYLVPFAGALGLRFYARRGQPLFSLCRFIRKKWHEAVIKDRNIFDQYRMPDLCTQQRAVVVADQPGWKQQSPTVG